MSQDNTGEYIIRQCRTEDFEQAASLLKGLWELDNDDMYLTQLKWKHRGWPEKVYATVVEYQKEIVGFLGLLPFTYTLNGTRVPVLCPVDLCVSSNHRRKGLFKKMVYKSFELFANSHKYMISYSTNPISTPGFLNMGWERVEDIKHLVRFRWGKAFSLTDTLNESEFSSSKIYCKIHTSADEYFGIRKKLSNPTSATIHLDWTYDDFTWRVAHPYKKYWFITFAERQGQQPQSCCCLTETHGMYQIADWAFTENSNWNGLLSNINKILNKSCSTYWAIPTTGAEYKAGLRNLYFDISRVIKLIRKTSFQPGMIIRPTKKNFDEKDWNIGSLDVRKSQSWNISPLAGL